MVRVADSLKQQNDLDTFPVAYGEDIWLDKNKGEDPANYKSLQAMYNDDELGGGGSSIQVDTMPAASAENVGKIVQYVGATGSYEHGCFYECKDESGSYVWRYISTVKNGVFYTSDNITDSTLYPVGSVAVYTGEPLWGLFKGHHYEYVEDTPLTTYKFNGTKNGETLSFFLANKELEVGSALVRISDGYIVSYVSAINGNTITIQGRTYTETFTDVVETGETEEVASYTGWIDIGGGGSDGGEEGTSIFYGTMDEWNALSTDAKKQYDYMADDDAGGSYIDAYSTTETKTNKVWIDGKPIYRKVYPVTITEPVSVTEIIITLDTTINKNNAKLISYGGYLDPGTSGDNYMKGIPYIFRTVSGDFASISCVIGPSGMAMIYTNVNPGNTGYVWVEYTKTTD